MKKVNLQDLFTYSELQKISKDVYEFLDKKSKIPNEKILSIFKMENNNTINTLEKIKYFQKSLDDFEDVIRWFYQEQSLETLQILFDNRKNLFKEKYFKNNNDFSKFKVGDYLCTKNDLEHFKSKYTQLFVYSLIYSYDNKNTIIISKEFNSYNNTFIISKVDLKFPKKDMLLYNNFTLNEDIIML